MNVRKCIVFLSLLSAFMVFSCQMPNNNMQTEGEIVEFNSVDNFENFIDTISADTVRSVLPVERSGSVVVNDEMSPIDLFRSILTEEGLIQIENWLIKIDEEMTIVGVITHDRKDLISDLLTNNLNNSDIMWFSTDDDVLELLSEGSTGTIKDGRIPETEFPEVISKAIGDISLQRVGDLQVPDPWVNMKYRKKRTYKIEGANNTYRYVNQIRYMRLGIYYQLDTYISRKNPVYIFTNCPTQGLFIDYEWRNKKKRKSGEYNLEAKGYVEKCIYSSVRSLKSFGIVCTYRMPYMTAAGTYDSKYEYIDMYK